MAHEEGLHRIMAVHVVLAVVVGDACLLAVPLCVHMMVSFAAGAVVVVVLVGNVFVVVGCAEFL